MAAKTIVDFIAKPVTFMLHSQQHILHSFVQDRLRRQGIDVQAAIKQQSKLCKVIDEAEYLYNYNAGEYAYTFAFDNDGICHAILGRDLEDDEDELSYSRTIVVYSATSRTVNDVLRHVRRYNGKLIAFDKCQTSNVVKKQFHQYDMQYHCELAAMRRQEKVYAIKAVKSVVQACDDIDVEAVVDKDSFANALHKAITNLASIVNAKFGISVQFTDCQLIDYENADVALFIEAKTPIHTGARYAKYASICPNTVGCRTMSLSERHATMLYRSMLSELSNISIAVTNCMQLANTLQNLSNNVVHKDYLRAYVPAKYQRALCR